MTTDQRDATLPDDEIPSWPHALTVGLLESTKGLVGGTPTDRDGVDGSVRTVATAFASNLLVAVSKFVAFFLSGSSAIMAEAVHSTAVTINQALMLHGRLSARRPATPDHPFGLGRLRYFWGFVIAVVMFGIGSVISIGRGVLALFESDPSPVAHPYIPLAALTFGLLMDGWSFLTARRQAKQDKGPLSYAQYVKKSKDPEVPVVLMEDSAALTSLAFAYAAVGLSVLTGDARWDAVGSIMVGVVLAVVSFILAREMRSLLIGESAEPEVRQQIHDILAAAPDVDRVVYVRTLHLGPSDLLVESKVQFAEQLTSRELAERIDRLQSTIRQQVPIARLIAIEPGLPGADDIEEPPFPTTSLDDEHGLRRRSWLDDHQPVGPVDRSP